jgi:hypothetical protein
VIFAWFEIVAGASSSTVTSKRTVTLAPTAMLPPRALSAPRPSRNVTVRVCASYSPRSSPAASVCAPGFSPSTIWREPRTKVTPSGSLSVSTVSVDSSLPVFATVIRYSMTSPRKVGAPFRSVAAFFDRPKSGPKVEIEVTHPARK